jgi:ABC-type thiamin/hydroxymethylpyrimidine transport system permease subunit
MDLTLLFQINYLAALVCAVVYFFIGALWFGPLFSTTWMQEVQNHGVTIGQPTLASFISKALTTLTTNFLTACAMAALINVTGVTTLYSGLVLGALVAFGFAATSIDAIFTWEGRSLKLLLLEVFYPVICIITCALIHSVWH